MHRDRSRPYESGDYCGGWYGMLFMGAIVAAGGFVVLVCWLVRRGQ